MHSEQQAGYSGRTLWIGANRLSRAAEAVLAKVRNCEFCNAEGVRCTDLATDVKLSFHPVTASFLIPQQRCTSVGLALNQAVGFG